MPPEDSTCGSRNQGHLVLDLKPTEASACQQALYEVLGPSLGIALFSVVMPNWLRSLSFIFKSDVGTEAQIPKSILAPNSHINQTLSSKHSFSMKLWTCLPIQYVFLNTNRQKAMGPSRPNIHTSLYLFALQHLLPLFLSTLFRDRFLNGLQNRFAIEISLCLDWFSQVLSIQQFPRRICLHCMASPGYQHSSDLEYL